MMNFKFKKGDRVKIEKLSDDAFNGIHPNGIDVGYCEYGVLQNDIIIDNNCIVADFHRFLNTSVITKILSDDTFKTKNSIYKLSSTERTSLLQEIEAEELVKEIDNMSIT